MSSIRFKIAADRRRHDEEERALLNVILVGERGAGKRTLLGKLAQFGYIVASTLSKPDFGIRFHPLRSGERLYTCMGLEGTKTLTRLINLCKYVHVVLYVLDAANHADIAKSKLELKKLAKMEAFAKCRFVIASNKHDGMAGIPVHREDLVGPDFLHLGTIFDKPHMWPHVLETSFLNDEGIREVYHSIIGEPRLRSASSTTRIRRLSRVSQDPLGTGEEDDRPGCAVGANEAVLVELEAPSIPAAPISRAHRSVGLDLLHAALVDSCDDVSKTPVASSSMKWEGCVPTPSVATAGVGLLRAALEAYR